MQSLISVATILALIAWSEGTIVIDLPGLGNPQVHRGIE